MKTVIKKRKLKTGAETTHRFFFLNVKCDISPRHAKINQAAYQTVNRELIGIWIPFKAPIFVKLRMSSVRSSKFWPDDELSLLGDFQIEMHFSSAALSEECLHNNQLRWPSG